MNDGLRTASICRSRWFRGTNDARSTTVLVVDSKTCNPCMSHSTRENTSLRANQNLLLPLNRPTKQDQLPTPRRPDRLFQHARWLGDAPSVLPAVTPPRCFRSERHRVLWDIQYSQSLRRSRHQWHNRQGPSIRIRSQAQVLRTPCAAPRRATAGGRVD